MELGLRIVFFGKAIGTLDEFGRGGNPHEVFPHHAAHHTAFKAEVVMAVLIGTTGGRIGGFGIEGNIRILNRLPVERDAPADWRQLWTRFAAPSNKRNHHRPNQTSNIHGELTVVNKD